MIYSKVLLFRASFNILVLGLQFHKKNIYMLRTRQGTIKKIPEIETVADRNTVIL